MKSSNFLWGRKILYICASLLLHASVAYCSDTVKVMSYNLLNYPEPGNPTADTSIRNVHFRTVMSNTNPDILVAQELTSQAGVNYFLTKVLNTALSGFAAGTFIDGTDSDNAVFFRTSKFAFINNKKINTELRDINEFTLLHLESGDTLRIYSVHLKASNTTDDENQRAREVDSLRKVTNLLPPGSDFIVCGDFNFYRASEPAYIKLKAVQPGNEGHVIDPIVMTGTWNNSIYAQYHTQSPRIRQFGGGTPGGLDDRFDMILYSKALSEQGGIDYIQGSLTAYGNDGNHYNDSINRPPNNAVSQQVADALHYAADHLPLIALLSFQQAQVNADVGIDSLVYPASNVCPGEFNAQVRLRNFSETAIDFSVKNVTVRIEVTAPSSTLYYFSHLLSTGSLSPDSTAIISIPVSMPYEGGEYIYTAFSELVDDVDRHNDTLSSELSVFEVTAAGISPQGSIVLCDGDSVLLSASSGNAFLWSHGATSQQTNTGIAGTYYVTVTDVNGCTSISDPVTISLHQTENDGVLFYETMGAPASTATITSFESSGGFDNDGLSMSGSGDVRSTSPSNNYPGASGEGNVFLTNIAGRNFIIAGINTTGLITTLSFGIHKSTTASTAADLNVAFSTDGVNYTPLSFSSLPAGSGTTGWYYRICAEHLPSVPDLYISFTNTGTSTQYRIDDITLSYEALSPLITSFTPGAGSIGDTVVLSGAHLMLTESLKFNDKASDFFAADDSTIITLVPDSASSGLISITAGLCDTAFSPDVFTVMNSGFTLNMKIYIEGFYSAGSMNLADTVVVAVHEPVSPYQLVESATAVINAQGEGTFYFQLPQVNSSYYISIKHRNSIETWSRLPVLISDPVMNFDLSSP